MSTFGPSHLEAMYALLIHVCNTNSVTRQLSSILGWFNSCQSETGCKWAGKQGASTCSVLSVAVCLLSPCFCPCQEVLTQLTSRLASQLNDLTIQIVKDEWSLSRPVPVNSSPVPGSFNSRLASSPPHLSPPHDNTPSPSLVPPHPYATSHTLQTI